MNDDQLMKFYNNYKDYGFEFYNYGHCAGTINLEDLINLVKLKLKEAE